MEPSSDRIATEHLDELANAKLLATSASTALEMSREVLFECSEFMEYKTILLNLRAKVRDVGRITTHIFEVYDIQEHDTVNYNTGKIGRRPEKRALQNLDVLHTLAQSERSKKKQLDKEV